MGRQRVIQIGADAKSFPRVLGRWGMRNIDLANPCPDELEDENCSGCKQCRLPDAQFFLPGPKEVPRPYGL